MSPTLAPPSHVAGLPLPGRLLELIELGRWPATTDEANQQNLASRVPRELIHRVAPDEDALYLDPPPFALATSLVDDDPSGDLRLLFSGAPDDHTAPGDIDFTRAVLIGDFGLGSDAPLVLDYRLRPDQPRVLRLSFSARNAYSGPKLHPYDGVRWVVVTDTFDELARRLEL